MDLYSRIYAIAAVPKVIDKMGCFKDKLQRALPHLVLESQQLTNQLCVVSCRQAGYTFAGTEASRTPCLVFM